MTDPERPSDIPPNQAAVYRRYTHLQSIRAERFPDASADSLAGLLLACVGFDQQGAELALATTISGGTFLGIDPSTDHLKAAVRNGACDFMVNTLDESLRVLKNEVRKKKALSVGLLGDAATILLAMVERGVQPDLLADPTASNHESSQPSHTSLLTFLERGAIRIDALATRRADAGIFFEVAWSAASVADLKRMDQLALRQLPSDDFIRQRWLQQAPAYFHRQRPLQRVLGMRQEELDRLRDAFRSAISAGEIPSTVTLVRQMEDGLNENVALG